MPKRQGKAFDKTVFSHFVLFTYDVDCAEGGLPEDEESHSGLQKKCFLLYLFGRSSGRSLYLNDRLPYADDRGGDGGGDRDAQELPELEQGADGHQGGEGGQEPRTRPRGSAEVLQGARGLAEQGGQEDEEGQVDHADDEEDLWKEIKSRDLHEQSSSILF